MYCHKCGKEINDDVKFCPECGATQNSAPSQVPVNHYAAPERMASSYTQPGGGTVEVSVPKKKTKPIYKKWWFWVICAVVLIGVLSTRTSEPKVNSSAPVSTDAGKHTDANEEIEIHAQTEENVPEVAEQVIYEGNDVIITATGIEKSGSGYNINLLIENNSALNLGFNAHAYAINGIMTRNNIYAMDCDVAAGKKANAKLELKGSVLNTYGISSVRCVDVLFWAYDNDAMFKEFDTEQIEIKTSLYDETHDYISGVTIYDADGIKVDYLGDDGKNFDFCITNTSGAYFNFDFTEITINDYTVTDIDFDLFDEVVLNNSQIVCTITVGNSFKQDAGISDVESVEWNMSIRPYGDYFDEYKIGPIVYLVGE